MKRSIFAAAAIFLSALPLNAQQIKVALPTGKVQIHSDEKLTGESKRDFIKQRKGAKFNSAFYLDTSSGKLYWAVGMHALSVALADAKEFCELRSAKNTCQLYATIVPRNAPEDAAAITLNKPGAKAFREYQKKQKDGGYGVFAVNGYFSFGYSWGYNSDSEALEAALLSCKAGATQGLAKAAKDVRDNIVNNKRNRCFAIHFSKP